MKPVIVVRLSGKNYDVECVSVHLFDTKEDAEKFCIENTDKEPDKYWEYSTIAEEGVVYEPGRYCLIKSVWQ